MSNLLEVNHLDAGYGQVQVLHDISLEVKAGEIVTVIGANGVGKTTLLRVISGILPVWRGEVGFGEKSIVGLKPEQIVRLGISQVPERRELFSSMTVLENLQLGAFYRWNHQQKDWMQHELEAIWEMFPILRTRQKQVAGTLSGGEQQMLAIARGLMAKPTLLLLDEPSLGLAPLLIQEILRIVSTLRKLGRTVLLVEQNTNGALQIADRAYLMEVGRITLHGTATELLSDERVRRAYLGRRVAPVHRFAEVKAPPQKTIVDKLLATPRLNVAGLKKVKEVNAMEPIPNALPCWTLPDEYFERRVSYTLEEIEAIQDRALPQAIAHAYEHSRFYREKFSTAGLTPSSILGLNDLHRLPFTSSEEIRPDPKQSGFSENYLAVPQKNVSLVHTSSGTTGSPKIFAYTGRDIANWAANNATVFWINGFRKSDIMLGVMPFGEFTGGGGMYLGMTALGLTYLPVSFGPGMTDKILAHLTGWVKINNHNVYLDPFLRANAMLCLGSFLSRLEEILEEHGIRPEELALTKITCGAEPSSDSARLRIAELLGIWPRDNYGLGEFFGPGVGGECEVGGGLHILSDAFIAEVLDPDSDHPTPVGEMGELVLTGLQKEAFPLFRYRTGDRVMAMPRACPCGNQHKWVGRIPGRIRTDDIVIPGGIVVNRIYFENILLQVNGTGAEYIVTVTDHHSRKGLQQLYVAIEGESESNLAEVIAQRIRFEYNHKPFVTVIPKGSLPRRSGKAKRICSPEEYRALVEKIAIVSDSRE